MGLLEILLEFHFYLTPFLIFSLFYFIYKHKIKNKGKSFLALCSIFLIGYNWLDMYYYIMINQIFPPQIQLRLPKDFDQDMFYVLFECDEKGSRSASIRISSKGFGIGKKKCMLFRHHYNFDFRNLNPRKKYFTFEGSNEDYEYFLFRAADYEISSKIYHSTGWHDLDPLLVKQIYSEGSLSLVELLQKEDDKIKQKKNGSVGPN